MVLVRGTKINENKYEMYAYFPNPDILDDEQRNEGFLLNAEIPVVEQMFGKKGVLYFDPINETIWAEYKDRKLTIEEELELTKQQLADLETIVYGEA